MLFRSCNSEVFCRSVCSAVDIVARVEDNIGFDRRYLVDHEVMNGLDIATTGMKIGELYADSPIPCLW